MHKLTLEIARGQWLMKREDAANMVPMVFAFLEGKEMKFPAAELSLGISMANNRGKTIKIKADTWYENPDTLFDEVTEDTVVTIPVKGVLTKYDVCGWYGAQTYAKVVDLAAANKYIKGIVLHVDSPGGSADGSTDFADAVARAKAVKPVISFIDGLGASALYRVPAHSSMIIAKRGSIVGSIGTMISFYDTRKAMERAGYKEINITATDSDEKRLDYEQALEGNFEPIRENLLDPFNDIFRQEMRALRNLPEETLRGKVFSAEKAIHLNMVDMIGSIDDAIQAAFSGINPTTGQRFVKNFPTKTENTFMKLPKLGASILAFLGLNAQPEQLSEEQVAQLEGLAGENARLRSQLEQAQNEARAAEANLQTATDASNSASAEVARLTAELSAAQGRETAALAERDALQTQVTELTAEVERLGKQPGAMPSVATSKKDDIEGSKTTDAFAEEREKAMK